MKLAAVVLAGGASSRLGEPKVLVDLDGRPALDRMLEALVAAAGASDGPSPWGEAPTLVVAGAHHLEISRRLAALPAGPELVRNRRWDAGRTTSVQAAVEQRPGADLLLWPADMPLVRATTIVAIVQEWDRLGSPPGGWMAPVLSEACAAEEGSPTARYGHPVVIGAALAAAVQSLAPDEPLRALRAQATRLLAAQVDDRAILDDLDTPEDLAALRGRIREER